MELGAGDIEIHDALVSMSEVWLYQLAGKEAQAGESEKVPKGKIKITCSHNSDESEKVAGVLSMNPFDEIGVEAGGQ